MELEKILKKLAHFQTSHPYMSIILILLLSILICGGVSKVQTVASLEKMMPYEIEEIKAIHTLRDSNMGQDMIAVVLTLNKDSTDSNSIQDITNFEVYSYINDLQNEINLQSQIITSHSYADVINYHMKYSNLSYDDILNLKQEELSQFINSDKTITMLIFSTDVSADDTQMNLLSTHIKEVISNIGHPRGVEIKLTGTPIIQQKLGELISADRTNTQWISTLLVLLITGIIFRSFTLAIIPVLVVFISVNWLYGTMGYTNLPISTLAGGVAAMVIGIGIDFAIHVMNKFKYERKSNKTIEESIELAIVHTGSALVSTSLTTMSAFLAFLIGVMPEMGRFGILMAIGILYSLIFSIFGLPALLVIEEKLIYYFSKKSHFGVEQEFHLEQDKYGGNKK